MRNVKIEVKATNGPGGQIDWLVDSKHPHEAKMELKKDSGSHKITFDLNDETGRALRFDTNQPICVGENCPCPPPTGINTDQIEIVACSNDRLTVVNGNWGDPRDLRYQLNVLDSQDRRDSVDPIIRNNGGIKG